MARATERRVAFGLASSIKKKLRFFYVYTAIHKGPKLRFNALAVNLVFIGDGRFGGERKSDVSAGDMATSRDFQAGPT